MENLTPLSLDEAIRRWRAEFGSPSSLSAAELEELEAHLRDHVAQLEAAGMKPEAAFAVAMEQLGDRQRVAGEFAKINPQRILLERGMWMLIGIMSFGVLQSVSMSPGILVRHLGLLAQWPAHIGEAAARLTQFSVLAAGGVVGWWVLTRRTCWGEGVSRLCVRQPQAVCIGLWLALYGASLPLGRFTTHVLNRLPPPADADFHRLVQVQVSGNVIGETIQNVLLATGVSLLALWVFRAHKCSCLCENRGGELQLIHVRAMERALWMMAGAVFQRIVAEVLLPFALLPAAFLNPSINGSRVAQHLAGLLTFVLVVAILVLPVWALWRLEFRRAGFGNWFGRTIRNHPWTVAAALATVLSLNAILYLVFLWAGPPGVALGVSNIVLAWQNVAWMGIQVGQVLLLVLLVIWHSKLREANGWDVGRHSQGSL